MNNAIENTIDDYEAMDIDEPEQMEISSEIMSRDNADTGELFINWYQEKLSDSNEKTNLHPIFSMSKFATIILCEKIIAF